MSVPVSTHSNSADSVASDSEEPDDGIKGLRRHWKTDLTAGLLVSLIALPLCLGIAMASGFPAFGGLITAIIGGLVVAPLCGSRLSIKGPAAGLIAIAIAAVETLGAGDNFAGYRYTLAVIAVASVLQILFAAFKLGKFGDFFPISVVHGMLAAIGIIIISKQIHPLLGVKPIAKDPIPLLLEIPHSLVVMNPEVALVGVMSVIIVAFSHKFLGQLARFFPGPLIAVLTGICCCIFFDFSHPHHYVWYGLDYVVDDSVLVKLPSNFLAGVTFPDFSKVFSSGSLHFILMFALIGSIESSLTVKAVDSLDPFKRRSNLNKDLAAVGLGNLISSLLGGLPMISEVVRSYSNVSYGAKTRWANFFHGLCLLMFLIALADIIHLVPTAALAGVLCVTGYRLAAPKHFYHSREIGLEQFVVFTSTVIGTLMTDLLVGVMIGVVAQFIACIVMGAPLFSLFTSVKSVKRGTQDVLEMPGTCYFGNSMSLKRAFEQLELDRLQGKAHDVALDFSKTEVVDHSFMREIRCFERDATQAGQRLTLTGLDRLIPLSHHSESARSAHLKADASHNALLNN